ncbi:hypothetical protein ABEB36_009588 [Hypothenemus hampei]|uniref:Uncharacterized protein n=1 Tax=Hypothenemus hampei TaxID=57062 RepID=A0ABD1EKX3_HYPHA
MADAISDCLFLEPHEELIFEDKEHEDLCSLSHPPAIDEDDSGMRRTKKPMQIQVLLKIETLH